MHTTEVLVQEEQLLEEGCEAWRRQLVEVARAKGCDAGKGHS